MWFSKSLFGLELFIYYINIYLELLIFIISIYIGSLLCVFKKTASYFQNIVPFVHFMNLYELYMRFRAEKKVLVPQFKTNIFSINFNYT